MKRGFQKSLALLLAVFMAFGAVPFFAVGMIASAVEPENPLKAITLNVPADTMKVGETQKLTVTATYADYSSKQVPADQVDFVSKNTKCITIEDDGTVKAIAPTEEGNPVTVTAHFGDLSDSKTIKVKPAEIPVKSILWNWDRDVLIVDDKTDYSFKYEVDGAGKPSAKNMYKIIPDNANVKTVTLECAPADALQIDNVNKTFKVNPLTDGKDSLTVVLTLTSEEEGSTVKSAAKNITIYKDVPIKEVRWTFKKDAASNKSGFSYFVKDSNGNATKELAVYYYKPTEMGDPEAVYKYEAVPLTGKTPDAKYLDLCEISVSSSDKRVIVFHEETGRIIPVGNGQATLTLTVKTPKGKVFRDNSVIAVVSNSPYTPITSVKIGYDEKNTDSDATYDKDTNTLSLMYSHSIQLTANLNTGASFDVKPIKVDLDNNDTLQTVKKIEYSWKSDDDSVATVDQTGKVTVTGVGETTITVTVNDNGTKITQEVKIKGAMSWWEALVGILMSLFSFRWNKIGAYVKALLGGLG